MNETTKQSESVERGAEAPFAARNGSATCCSCVHWEHGQTPRLIAASGYCPIFDKKTWAYHGEKCTAHSVTGSPNGQAHPTAAGRTGGAQKG